MGDFKPSLMFGIYIPIGLSMESTGQVVCARIDLLRALSALTLYAPGRLKVLFSSRQLHNY